MARKHSLEIYEQSFTEAEPTCPGGGRMRWTIRVEAPNPGVTESAFVFIEETSTTHSTKDSLLLDLQAAKWLRARLSEAVGVAEAAERKEKERLRNLDSDECRKCGALPHGPSEDCSGGNNVAGPTALAPTQEMPKVGQALADGLDEGAPVQNPRPIEEIGPLVVKTIGSIHSPGGGK